MKTFTKTISYTILFCKKEFTTMSVSYRKIRERLANPSTLCFVCEDDFVNGDKVGLVQVKCNNGISNEIICKNCASKITDEKHEHFS